MGKENERSRPRRTYILKSVAIIGPNGQLGTDLVKTFREQGWDVTPLTHEKIQVENLQTVRESLKNTSVDWIVNTAAFHKEDECEKNSEKAWLINSAGPANVALVANEIGAKAVFISSDYVFSGNKEIGHAYLEDDHVSPVNAYGHSKAAGELATLTANPKNLVVRISSVFGAAGSSGKGGNFVETILNKARAGEPLNVVDDIYMNPTYTVDASLKIVRAIDQSYSGIIHASNGGSTTWFSFAEKILVLSGLKTTLTSAKTDWSLPLKRPMNSALDVTKTEALTGIHASWEDSLHRYLFEKGHLS